jgi:hypothetical protein
LAFWSVREELSQANRLRRSYYELLRDELDQQLIQHSLIDSYTNFRNRKVKYPFVEKRELKPRARIPDLEYECQNVFLVVFVEDTIPPENKKYIRFFDVNKTTKANLLQSKTLPLANKIDRNQRYQSQAEKEYEAKYKRIDIENKVRADLQAGFEKTVAEEVEKRFNESQEQAELNMLKLQAEKLVTEEPKKKATRKKATPKK